ncbi:hypothetical protein DPEC_G00081060 [Dallia pectoralis]|uniref:Uncharacterized protein n=1 Tax=Dallia pectoralis TaxID=75939 RepID=A0ACC2GZF2_DALPE|nr:hypothetical protein DPEC_G00081060 [Dallia pectoralis]
MELENSPSPYKDHPSRQSRRSTGKHSETPSRPLNRDESRVVGEKESCAGDRAKTRIREPDPDIEHQRSSGSFYSEDYENLTPSERSLSPYSRTPSPGTGREGPRAKRVPSSPLYKKGVRRGVSRPPRVGIQPQRWGVRTGSQSLNKDKESTGPPKDLDLVTKRTLSARLLKINELRNALAEMQLRTDQLTKENRVLRQLQFRQERALQRYDDTDSEIAQLLSRHANETTALREHLRRAQERERAAERHCKDTQEALQRSQSSLGRLKRLVEQQELGPREELTKRLEVEKIKDQENQRRIKELERSLELLTSSYQRQVTAEKRKTLSAQEQITALQEEMERLSNKLKEKDRELDTRNIYANRMLKASPRNHADPKRKGPTRSNSKAVQTQNTTLSLDLASSPPTITDSDSAPNDYLSLKPGVCRTPPSSREVDTADQTQETHEREEKEKEERLDREINTHEEKARRQGEGCEKEEEEKRRWTHDEEEHRKRRSQVQQEVERRNQEALASQEAAEAERCRKEQLLAKLREIDRQSKPPQNAGVFSEVDPNQPESGSSLCSPPWFSENGGVSGGVIKGVARGGSVSGGVSGVNRDGLSSGHGGAESILGASPGTGTGRRGQRAQNSSEDLAFGSYAPSFGRPSHRGGTGFPPPPTPSALEAMLGWSERERGGLGVGAGKEKKSDLLKQLFGSPSSPSPPSNSPPAQTRPRPPEVLPRAPAQTGREGIITFDPKPLSTSPPYLLSLHVNESRPTVRAMASFDDDIEELTL